MRNFGAKPLNLSGGGTGLNVALRGFLGGFGMANNGTTSIDVAAGVAASDDFSTYLSTNATLTKTTAAWAFGSATGGLDTGTIAAATWYYFFVIGNPTTGAVDVLFSASLSPTMPTGFTKKRRIGAMLYGSSAWTPFVQVGAEFIWVTPIVALNSSTSLASGASNTVSLATGIPPLIRVKARLSLTGSSATAGALTVYSAMDSTAGTGIGIACKVYVANSGGVSYGDILTNASGQIRVTAVTAASTAQQAVVIGWIDNRDAG